MSIFPTPAVLLPPRGVHLASANARVFFSDPRKAQFRHERSRQKANRERFVRSIRGMQVHQHGKSNPTHPFSLSAKTVGGING